MRRIAEKPDLMNTVAVKVRTQVGISSNLEPARKPTWKRETLIVQVEFGKTISIERVE